MKTIACLALFVAAAVAQTTYAGYWEFYTSDCTSTEAGTTTGNGVDEGYFFPTDTCTEYNGIGYGMFEYSSYGYIFSCNDTAINWEEYYDYDCSGTVQDTGYYPLDVCGTGVGQTSYASYECITDDAWPSPDDFDDMDVLDPSGGPIETVAAVEYYSDTACANSLAVVVGAYQACEYPYYRYCDGDDFTFEYCTNFDGDCGSGCVFGSFAPEAPLDDSECYISTTLPAGWDFTYGTTFDVDIDSYYQSAALVFCEGEGAGSNGVALSASMAVVAVAAALVF
jgi:hypothetical protein